MKITLIVAVPFTLAAGVNSLCREFAGGKGHEHHGGAGNVTHMSAFNFIRLVQTMLSFPGVMPV